MLDARAAPGERLAGPIDAATVISVPGAARILSSRS